MSGSAGDVVPGSREALEAVVADRHPATVALVRFFAWAHLPPHLKDISAPCSDLALAMATGLPDGDELRAGLRKLLEGKDCFVRAVL